MNHTCVDELFVMGEEIKPLLVLHAVACEILEKRRKEKKKPFWNITRTRIFSVEAASCRPATISIVYFNDRSTLGLFKQQLR